MLKHTFRHIHGVGEKIEQRLWIEGITQWEELLDSPHQTVLAHWQRDIACRELEASLHALERRDAAYFMEKLPASLHWRLYPEFAQRIAYLDIETTGLADGLSNITVIGMYDGERPHVYVRGRNLFDFAAHIEEFSLVVTYNGKLFDVPYIRRELGVPLAQAHIDLRYPLAKLGYKGGLKKIERILGMERQGPLALLDGWCAVVLWEYYQQGKPGALETLLRYNLEDVIHLPALLAQVYNTAVQRLPFPLSLMYSPSPPPLPFAYNEGVIELVLAATGRWVEENTKPGNTDSYRNFV